MLKTTFRLKADILRLFTDAISASRAHEQEWRTGFEAMGADPDTNDVKYMMSAAREVLFEVEDSSGDEEVNFTRC